MKLSHVALGLVASSLLAFACGPEAPPPATPTPPTPVVATTKPTPSTTPAPAPAPPIDGMWHGLLAGRLHLDLALARGADGTWSGKLDSVDQGAAFAIERVTVDADGLRFAIASIDGSFAGKIEGGRIVGTWTQRGHGQPLAFAREPAPQAAEKPQKPLDAPVEIAIATPPIAFRADDKTHLVYELSVSSFSRRPLSLKRIEVKANGKSLARWEGAELGGLLVHPGLPDGEGAERLRIRPGTRAVAYLWVTLNAGGDAAPAALEHDVTVQMDGDTDELTVPNVKVTPSNAKPPVVGAPLRGKSWVAGNGPANGSRHRRALIAIGGRPHISQRFAIDFVKVGDDGKTFTGDPKKNASYLAYGQEALAVGDGAVVAAKDGIAENTPGDDRAVPITLDTVSGNHVIVDLGGGFFGFYAHFQPGSLKVKVGDRVKRGQVLGLVGNSGNSTEPHLHFHVSDAKSPLGSEGVPYLFERFESRAPTKPGEKPGAATPRTKQLPTEDQTIAFP